MFSTTATSRRLSEWLSRLPSCRRRGRLQAACGPVLSAVLPRARVGEVVEVGGERKEALVVAFDGQRAQLLCLEAAEGLKGGEEILADGRPDVVPFSAACLGRILDARGKPIDGLGALAAEEMLEVDFAPPPPLRRRPLDQPLITGLRVIDCLLPLARGQRVGLLAGPGMGKSTLLGQLARGARADCVVLALVGERGREVNEFISRDLGAEGLRRSVVVCATSDCPAAERARALPLATALAHGFRRRGKSVLLLADSLTRHARALREVALGSGEPLLGRGYPPSVFDALASLLERAGDDGRQSITAIYTVLVEGEENEDALAEEVKSLLDGHLVLSAELARAGIFPALDVGASLSRLADRVAPPEQMRLVAQAKLLWSVYQNRRLLIESGLYQEGSDADIDRARRFYPRLLQWLRQDSAQLADRDQGLEALRLLLEENHG
jgi:FliI/YscN family ATPase